MGTTESLIKAAKTVHKIRTSFTISNLAFLKNKLMVPCIGRSTISSPEHFDCVFVVYKSLSE